MAEDKAKPKYYCIWCRKNFKTMAEASAHVQKCTKRETKKKP